jgi:hypothetical protein
MQPPHRFLADPTCSPEVLNGADPVTIEAVAPDHGSLALWTADVEAVALCWLNLVVFHEVGCHDVADGRDAVESQDPNAVATLDFV